MHVYCWDSQALKAWGPGVIIVMARTPHEARKKARSHARNYFDTRFDWLRGDDDETFGFEAKFREFSLEIESDLAKDPTIPPDGVIYMKGSE
jgi:alkanesulfonate monooxygenase SsuD/methylene tetrahydromethanopterin reductase-like flavin-dependent oxidoreductase (luciferase family)